MLYRWLGLISSPPLRSKRRSTSSLNVAHWYMSQWIQEYNRSISSGSSSFRISSPSVDFAHHKQGVARLNHASFGAVPAPVLRVQDHFRHAWLEQPDEWYFTGKLHQQIRDAAVICASKTLLSPFAAATPLPPLESCCLVENATIAACAVAYRWCQMINPGDVILYFNVAYKACIHILREYCETKGAKLIQLNLAFLPTSQEQIVETVRQQLEELRNSAGVSARPRFAFLDHVSSQPAIIIPVAPIARLIREYGTPDAEICVDGAHAVGSVPVHDIAQIVAPEDGSEPPSDFYFSNLHKWGFAPSSATIMYSPKFLPEMKHPIVSWGWGKGMAEESLFPGTRDFSAFLTVPAAVEYLNQWDSSVLERNGHNDEEQEKAKVGKCSSKYCHDAVIQAARKLSLAWGTDGDVSACMDESLVATQAMVRLPYELVVNDTPGQPDQGVRDILRHRYGVEAAVGNFGKERGAYVRLSYAIYNTSDDIQRLEDGVLDILQNQRQSSSEKP